MSTVISLKVIEFQIARRDLAAMVPAVKRAARSRLSPFAAAAEIAAATTVDQVLDLTDFTLAPKRGPITKIAYGAGELPTGCGILEVRAFLAHLAPFVRKGSRLEVVIEDLRYELRFDGKTCKLGRGKKLVVKRPRVKATPPPPAPTESELRAEIAKTKHESATARFDTWRALMLFLIRHDRWDEATDLVEANLETFPEGALWYHLIWRWERAMLLLATGRIAELERALPWCLDADPREELNALHYRVAILLDRGLVEEASAAFEGVDAKIERELGTVQLRSSIIAALRCRLDQAMLFEIQGNDDAALAVYRSLREDAARRSAPDEQIDRCGRSLLGAGDYAAAIARARDLPNHEYLTDDEVRAVLFHYEALVVIGRASIALDDAHAAIDALTAATAKIPSQPLAWYHLARARALAKAPANAIAEARSHATGMGWQMLAARDPLLGRRAT